MARGTFLSSMTRGLRCLFLLLLVCYHRAEGAEDNGYYCVGCATMVEVRLVCFMEAGPTKMIMKCMLGHAFYSISNRFLPLLRSCISRSSMRWNHRHGGVSIVEIKVRTNIPASFCVLPMLVSRREELSRVVAFTEYIYLFLYVQMQCLKVSTSICAKYCENYVAQKNFGGTIATSGRHANTLWSKL